MKSILLLLIMGLVMACSDDGDTARKDTGAKDQATTDLNVDDQATTDQAATDQGLPDSTVPDQKAPSPDGPKAKVLDNKHTGWNKKGCGTCHNLPPKGHTASKPPECAKCHGGNGSCNPPVGHSKSMSCTGSSCHAGGRHGYTKNADCVACHYAAAGTAKCGPP